MMAVSLMTMLFELYWIQVVYSSFPELERDDLRKEEWGREPDSYPVTSAMYFMGGR
jgi:hypothetical protein